MKLKSWGNYPKFEGRKLNSTLKELQQSLKSIQDVIAQGNHRSYGDSAFAEHIIDMKSYDIFIDFDTENGILECQLGVLLKEVLEVTIPKNWIMPVLPGTQLISIGGAIASDIHGKNHHQVGTISQFIESFNLMLADGQIVNCSKQQNEDLFKATCGGMGLTGLILDAKIKLTPLKSTQLNQKTIKTKNLDETLKIFETNLDSSYSVAWFDCLSEEIGKSLVMLADHDTQIQKQPLEYNFKFKHFFKFYWPSFLLNQWTVKIFNKLYYNKAKEGENSISIGDFFFPLDRLANWNKLYGKKGFIQYQCVLPLDQSSSGLTQILEKIKASGQGSFLAVLKRMGPENDNYLSFPMQGYTLALDFKANHKVLKLLSSLDDIVLAHHGRIYFCKDSRVNHEVVNQSYPQINQFRELRESYKLNKVFNSQQSKRLKL